MKKYLTRDGKYWVRMDNEGVEGHIGVTRKFLNQLGELVAIAQPRDIVCPAGNATSCFEGCKGVAAIKMPFAYRVLWMNEEALARPNNLTENDWVIAMMPNDSLHNNPNLVEAPDAV